MNRRQLKIALMIIMLMAFGTWGSSLALAQGSIFGAVHNSDLSVPDNGEITFFGYINGSDNEIRTESSIGAGYDNGNWFDDFQNFLDESAGQPYQYRFFNITNGEGFILDDIIPNNSFQQEDVPLISVDWPPMITNLYAQALADGKVLLGWEASSGYTFHVYRRLNVSAGSFYRIDDPSGNLANPGVSSDYYIDTGVDGASTYDYLIVAENSSGVLGAHSEIIVVNSSALAAPVLEALTPDTGPAAGGTPVTITGSGFDVDGALVAVGSEYLAGITVVSPNKITGITLPGAEGAVDVLVTNIESGLSSNILAGGFSYVNDQNAPPVLYGVSAKNGLTDQLLAFNVYSIDTDGDEVIIMGRKIPDGSELIYNGYNSISGYYEAAFSWTPGISDAGLHDSLEILAYDLLDTTTATLPIRIFDNGFVCGDADGNWIYNLLDIIYLIGYIYNDPPGPAPAPLQSGDANGNGTINLLDILYLIAYIYNDPPGPAPVCPL